VAWSKNLGGLPVDPRVTAVLEKQRKVFEGLGCIVEEAEPDLTGADEVFQVLRALGYVQRLGPSSRQAPSAHEGHGGVNTEQGLAMDAPRVARAMSLRADLFRRMREFLARYEFLCLPVNQVPPFPVTQPWVDTIAGVKLATYIDWMKTCCQVTVTSHPAISVPAGFTGDDPPLPVGLQIVGRYRDDLGVLQMAHAFEARREWRGGGRRSCRSSIGSVSRVSHHDKREEEKMKKIVPVVALSCLLAGCACGVERSRTSIREAPEFPSSTASTSSSTRSRSIFPGE